MTRFLLCLLFFATTADTLQAAPVDSLFLGISAAEMPELDRSARMDLLDFWDSGLEARTPGTFGDTICLVSRTDSALTLQLADAAVWRIRLLGPGRGVWEREVRLPGRKEAFIRRKDL